MEKFFGCTAVDMDEKRAEAEANRPIDPKTLVKQQFVMSKSSAIPRKYTSKLDLKAEDRANKTRMEMPKEAVTD